ncbi:MAG: hypothetical protein IPL86_15895 [Flavobacteriales bacterium]|nr:hypothetical protein [Flavobacteriales bacterium]
MIAEYTLANNVRSVLLAGINNSVATITATAAASPYNPFPAPAGGYPGVCTLIDSLSLPTKIETVTYTGRTANGSDWDLTGCARGQFGTTAQSWSAGAIMICAPTAEMLTGRLPIAIIADQAGCTVIGRSASTTGAGAVIPATNNTVLRRRADVLGFGSLIDADIDAAAAIALSKLASQAAQSVVGRASGSGVPSALAASDWGVLNRVGSGNLGFSTLTGQHIRQAPLTTAATAITLDDATHHGRILVCTSNSAITITCDTGPSAFFECLIIQAGTGHITFVASGIGVNVRNVHGYTKTSGQYAKVGISVYSAAPNQFLLEGETAP